MGRSGEEGKKYDLAVLAAARLFLKDPRPETTKRFFAIVNWYTCFMSNESGACEDFHFILPRHSTTALSPKHINKTLATTLQTSAFVWQH